ncbi:bifunctional DNA-formamidopyrimidine glycosylase/DNA-(apurinic or apyrimidinic site) lyase [Alginatibacterium sediminis]|uniref:Formamidopyrimidine-DNA glycosylase n=1 Tax=Alginatibacterium sediminis TaxID=2164068 RepID=A0A420EN51_9ALTE|nr:bifunctional DNA-formamidopyrimidine glycosylase/DNA-(apurinic or apyrimidinic site) lyase [Alginatibacterium sediminis]RKF22142.1 bifunctional DNA-formamidopyrimidine glycosylase/DNA-(apurinic or apyrimidinic site) lyase [Alginatibacterium sediminis]
MPELPEVETSRRGIEPHLVSHEITEIVVRNPKLRWPIPSIITNCIGHRITAVKRRAKYLLVETQAGTILIHLGMSGSLKVLAQHETVLKHDHVDICLSSGMCLRLNDPRRFGAVLYTELPWQEHKLLTSLGPEPLSDDFSPSLLFQSAKRRSIPVKQLIMDNHVVVGVGNIYACEALFRSGIHPQKAANKVSATRYANLCQHIKEVLAQAIEQGGTTLKDFSNADGKPGYFKQELAVYGRQNQACHSCGEHIQATRIGQRNSFFCPNCQR